MQHGRDWSRELARRSPAAAGPEVDREGPDPVPGRLGRLLRFGNSATRIGKIMRYAQVRLALFISKRNRRSREFG